MRRTETRMANNSPGYVQSGLKGQETHLAADHDIR
jgi:hypothetical protein